MLQAASEEERAMQIPMEEDPPTKAQAPSEADELVSQRAEILKVGLPSAQPHCPAALISLPC